MKKVFILTGEPSGDKLASKVISDLKKILPIMQTSANNLKKVLFKD